MVAVGHVSKHSPHFAVGRILVTVLVNPVNEAISVVVAVSIAFGLHAVLVVVGAVVRAVISLVAIQVARILFHEVGQVVQVGREVVAVIAFVILCVDNEINRALIRSVASVTAHVHSAVREQFEPVLAVALFAGPAFIVGRMRHRPLVVLIHVVHELIATHVKGSHHSGTFDLAEFFTSAGIIAVHHPAVLKGVFKMERAVVRSTALRALV
jgi:hypothetical protein